MCGGLALTILGGFFEVLGLGTVAWEVTRLQRQEFGQPVLLAKLEGLARRVLRRSRSVTVEASSGIGIGTGISARARVTRGPAVLLEDKVRRLETVVEDLRQQIDNTEAMLEGRIGTVEGRVGRLQTTYDKERQEQEQTRKASLRRHVTYEATGTLLFFFGAVLSVVGNAWTC